MSDNDEKQTEHDAEPAAAPGLPSWVGPLLGIALVLGVVIYITMWWMRINNAPDKVVEKAASLIEEKKFDELRVELAKLEGIPRYELHMQVLNAAILIGEGKFGEVEPYLQHLPEDAKIRAMGLLNHGIARYHQQRYPEAIDFFEQAIASDASFQDANQWIARSKEKLQPGEVLKRGQELISINDWKSFSKLIEDLNQDPEGKSHAELLRGMAFVANGDLTRAVQAFDIAAQNPEILEPSLLGLGNALASLGRVNEARQVYWKLASENEKCVEAHYWLALYYYDNGALDWAGLHLKALAELLPNDPRPNRMMGFTSRDFRQYDQAIHHYQEALRRNPRGLMLQQILIELADCFVKNKNFDEARRILGAPPLAQIDKSLALDRRVLDAQCLASEGEAERALQELEQVLKQDPKMVNARLAHGEILLGLGEYKEAIETLEIAVKLQPEEFTIYHKLEMAHRRAGNTKRADELSKEADRRVKLTTKLSELNEKANSDPDDPDIRYELGLANLESGNVPNARQWFISALRINPEHKARQELLKLERPANQAEPKLPADSGQNKQEPPVKNSNSEEKADELEAESAREKKNQAN